MSYFRQRVTVAGNVVTVLEFEKAVAVDFTASSRSAVRQDLTEEEREDNRKRSASRARRELQEAIDANFGWCPRKNRFGQWSLKFLTLTYKENMQDYSQLARDFDRFMKRLKYHLGAAFEYVAVPEQQKRGAWHLHILLYCPFIPIDTLKRLWHESQGQGSFKINQIQHVQDVGAYVSKYMSKDMSPDSPLYHKKRYWASRGFTKQAKHFRFARSVDTPILRTFTDAKCVSKVKESEYENEWTGKVKKQEIVLFPCGKSQRLVENLLEVLVWEQKDDDPIFQQMAAKAREISVLTPPGVLVSRVPSYPERVRAWETAGLLPGVRSVDASRLRDTPPERSRHFTRGAAGRGAYQLTSNIAG